MTVKTSIDPARLLEEQLAQATADLLHELLLTFINTLSVGRARRGVAAESETGQVLLP